MNQRQSLWWMAGICAAALALRLGVGLAHPLVFPDSEDYLRLAENMLAGRGYESVGLYGEKVVAHRMPGYPMLLAGWFAVTGTSVKAAVVLNALLGAVTCWLVYGLGRRVSEGAGMAAAGIVALDPLLIGFSAAVLSEVPFTCVLTGMLWVVVRECPVSSVQCPEGWGWGYGRRLVWWGIYGVLAVVGIYLRGSLFWLALGIPVAVVAVVMRRAGRAGAKEAAPTMMGGMMAVVVICVGLWPWWARNVAMAGMEPGALTTLEGISLYESVYGEADGGPRQDRIGLPEEMKGMTEAQRDREWRRRAWEEIKAHPGRLARLAVVKVGRTWSPLFSAAEFRNPWTQAVLLGWSVGLYALAVIGLGWGGIRGWMLGVLLVPIFYFSAVHAVFLGSVRYRVPLLTLVAVLAGVGVLWAWECFRGQTLSQK